MSETHDKELRYFIVSYATSFETGEFKETGFVALTTDDGKYVKYKDLEKELGKGLIIKNIIELNEDDYNDFIEE